MNQRKKQENRVIQPKSLLIRTLLRWKSICLCTLIACILAGGYAYRKEVKAVNASSKGQTSEVDHDYQTYVKAFDEAIAARYAYLENTVVKDMNPYAQPVAATTLFVRDNNEEIIIDPDVTNTIVTGNTTVVENKAANLKTSTLLSGLYYYVLNGIPWTEIQTEFNLPEGVLVDELVQATLENDLLVIKTYQSTTEDADRLLEYVMDHVTVKFDELVSLTGYDNTELVVLDRNTDTKIFSNNFSWLTNRVNEINALVDAKAKFINTYSTQVSSISNSSKTSVSKKYILKTMVKGGILGFGLSVFLVMMYLIFSAKVLSSGELLGNYNMQILGVLPSRYRKKEVKGISRRIIRMDKNEKSDLPEIVRLELADSLIEKLHGNTDDLVVISDLDKERMQKIVGELNESAGEEKYKALSGIRDNIQDRKALAKAGGVILAVGIEESSYPAIDDLLELVESYQIPFIGTIVC